MKKGAIAAGLVISVALGVWVFSSAEEATDAQPAKRVSKAQEQGRQHTAAASGSVIDPHLDADADADGGAELNLVDAGESAEPIRVRVQGSVVLAGRHVSGTVHLGKAVIVAGDDGRFSWEGTVTGDIACWAERGPLRSAATVVEPEPGRPLQLQLVLTEPVRVSGRVVGAPDRRPLPGMKVTLKGVGDGEVVTDERGAFTTANAAAGYIQVISDGDAQWGSGWATFHLEAGRVNEVELTLQPVGRLSGRVLDGKRAPVAGATVRLEPVATGGTGVEAQSSADGSFHFEHLASSAYFIVAEHALGRSASQTTVPGSHLELVLAPAATLDVTVTLEGEPAAGYECSLTTERDVPNFDLPRLTTGNDGTAHFVGLRTGTVHVWVRKGLSRWRLLGSPALHVGENHLGGDVGGDGRRVELRVVDLDRAPVEGARVVIEEEAKETDADGTVVFEDLDPKQDLTVTASADGYPAATVPIAEGAKSVQVVLHHWRTMRGVAVNSQGRPVPELRVDEHPLDLGPDGKFEQLIPGTDSAEPRVFSCTGCMRQTVDVPAGHGDVDLGKLVFAEGGTLHFFVTLPDGRPASFAKLFVVDKEKLWLTPADRKGSSLDVDASGQVRLNASRPSCSVAWRADFAPSARESCPHDVKPGEVLKVNLRLRAGAFVEGTVRRNGLPVENAVLAATEEKIEAVTDARGKYRLGPLSPGAQQVAVLVSPAAMQVEMKSVTLTEGATLTLDIGQDTGQSVTLEWSGAATQLFAVVVPGHFTFEEMEKHLQKKPLDTEARLQRVPPGSKPVFDSLPEGTWTALVMDDNHNLGTATFTVAKGQDPHVPVTAHPK